MQSRLTAFKPVIEAVVDESITDEACVEFLLAKRIESALHDLLCQVGPETLLLTIQKLGSSFPDRVYWFVAEALRQGAIIAGEKQKEMMRPFGFHPPAEPDSH